MYRRDAFDDVGGYPAINLGIDQALEQSLRSRGKSGRFEMPRATEAVRKDIYYIYRWGVSPIHISGNSKPVNYDRIGRRPIADGTFLLRPHWRMDYEQSIKSIWDEPQFTPWDGPEISEWPPIPIVTDQVLSIFSRRD